MPEADSLAMELYAAALDGRPLDTALTGIVHALGAETGFVTRMRFSGDETADALCFTQHGFDPGVLQEYSEHWRPHDPKAAVCAKLPRAVLNLGRLIPEHEFERSAFWNEFGAKHALGFYSLAATMDEPGDVTALLSVQRPRHTDGFGPAEEALMQALYPHVQRALLAEARLSTANLQTAALGAGLDALTQGVAVIGEDGRLAYANAALLAMVAERDGLALGTRGLVASDASG